MLMCLIFLFWLNVFDWDCLFVVFMSLVVILGFVVMDILLLWWGSGFVLRDLLRLVLFVLMKWCGGRGLLDGWCVLL